MTAAMSTGRLHVLQALIRRDYVIWVIFHDQDTAVGAYVNEVDANSMGKSRFIRWLGDFSVRRHKV
jgi:hypothetical protein